MKFPKSLKFGLILTLIFILIFNLNSVYSANVSIYGNLYQNYSIFYYNFTFSKKDDYNLFSFAKPKESKIIFSKDNLGKNLPNIAAGDFFVFNPINYSVNKYYVKFKTTSLNKEIKEKDFLTLFLNFNFKVENLNISLNFGNLSRNITNLYPSNYEENDNIYTWHFKNINNQLMIMINFNSDHQSFKEKVYKESKYFNITYNPNLIASNVKNETKEKKIFNIFNQFVKNYLFIFILISVIILSYFIFVTYKLLNNLMNENKKKSEETEKKETEKNTNDEKKEEKKEHKISNTFKTKVNEDNEINFQQENINISIINEDKKIEKEKKEEIIKNNKEKFEEFLETYLTDNEKKVVKIVKEKEGIIQNEILNSLDIKKANLSKIIKKLDNKKILNRVRVGKVNKIFLGEKLKEIIKDEKKDD